MMDGWKCDCGHVEYGKFPPAECPNCWQANGFVAMSEEMAEKMKDSVLEHIKKEVADDDECFEEE